MIESTSQLGANVLADGRTSFCVWAPSHPRVVLRLARPGERHVPMQRDARGYHSVIVDDAPPGTEYYVRLASDVDRPDPASRRQPQGVHGPSCVIEPSFPWTDKSWVNPPLAEHVIYELHVGTFTRGGTFEAAIAQLDDLRALGVTAIELMPVAEFPGSRNWGYDGVCLFAAHHAHGGVAGLKRLVDACHARGLAVILDVVYNHLGPEGNYLAEFGPYFTDAYRTPWGAALNFDGPDSDEVRRFFIENALYWVEQCHVDGLRLDAVHAILDRSPTTFLEQLGQAVHAAGARLGRRILVIAESCDNDPRLIRPTGEGGLGLDAVWNDDFHHAVRTLLTGERDGYYIDYGTTDRLARTLTDGFTYTGQYSTFRRRSHGRAPIELRGDRFVVCCQNHDQIGNRPLGDRLTESAGFEGAKVAAGLTLLGPFVPLLFMGEEFAAPSPFQYFISHTDAKLVEAVRRGRREEFTSFDWPGAVPDPQADETFERCKLDWALRSSGRHGCMLGWYQALLLARKSRAALSALDLTALNTFAHPSQRALGFVRSAGVDAAMILANCEESVTELRVRPVAGAWERVLDSTDRAWGGDGPHCAVELNVAAAPMAVRLPPRSLALYCLRSR